MNGKDITKRFGDAIQVGEHCIIADDVQFKIASNAELIIGNRVTIDGGVQIQALDGALIRIANGVTIGRDVSISAAVGIAVGENSKIDESVEIRDFHVDDNLGAPIVIENGVRISKNSKLFPGIRISQNAIVESDSLVVNSVLPNAVVAGGPATQVGSVDAVLDSKGPRQQLHIGWFGTSLMEHYEAFNEKMTTQSALPSIGEYVVVEGWRNRGYVHRLQLDLQASWAHLAFSFVNRAEGGATSRDLLGIIEKFKSENRLLQQKRPLDIAFFGCGVNDVWRKYQHRIREAVDLDEYRDNYSKCVDVLKSIARFVVCVGETPIGWDDEIDVSRVNEDIRNYNKVAGQIANLEGVIFVDTWEEFAKVACQLSGWNDEIRVGTSLWSDGVHYSELGDAVIYKLLRNAVANEQLIEQCARYELLKCSDARYAYRELISSL